MDSSELEANQESGSQAQGGCKVVAIPGRGAKALRAKWTVQIQSPQVYVSDALVEELAQSIERGKRLRKAGFKP
jgi:hypothetical protein